MKSFMSKNGFSLLVFVLAALACAAMYFFSTISNKELDYEPVYEYQRLDILPQKGEEVEEIVEDTYVIPKDEWFLKLVNKENPITADYVIKVKAINSIGYYFDERALVAVQTMLADGEKEGMHFKISSAYRTLERQTALYQQKVADLLATGYTQPDAEAVAATLVSPPGTSEHNLGLGIDIIAATTVVMDETFEQTPEFKWLTENCTKYGFILRYPKDKEDITKVTYEPWHFRYVGLEDAKRIAEQGVCLEEYLA